MASDYYLIDIVEEELYHNSTEMKALYYGTPEDNILVWKEGMDLPKASEEVENMFHFE